MTSPSNPPQASPLVGWGPPPRGVFVDVIGTIVKPLNEEGHFPHFDGADFYNGVLDALFRVTQSGWSLYLVGNIDSVAFGAQSYGDWKEFQGRLHTHLRSLGIKMCRDYTCVDHPEGVKGRDRDSVYYLPGTGAMHHAAQADGIKLPLSWVVGDSSTELVAGWRAGCRIAGVRSGNGVKDGAFHVDPELVAETAGPAIQAISRDMTMLRRVA